MTFKEVSTITDETLLNNLEIMIKRERQSISHMILHLAEIDRRKLYLKEGYSSLFSYCTKKYHFSEESAYRRIQAARLCIKFPEVLVFIERGKVNLTTLNLIAPHLTPENKKTLLLQVQGLSKREVEKVLASLFPQKIDIKDNIRRLPTPKARTAHIFTVAGEGKPQKEENAKLEIPFKGAVGLSSLTASSSPKRKEMMKPITARFVKIEFRAGEKVAKKIERAKEILRHKYPHGTLEEVIDQALEDLLEKRDPERKIARIEKKETQKRQTKERPQIKIVKPSKQKRYIPADLKRAIFKRDHGECSYKGPNGRRCGEKNALEIDHVKPFGIGGESTPENLRLLCRNHNQWRIGQTFRVKK